MRTISLLLLALPFTISLSVSGSDVIAAFSSLRRSPSSRLPASVVGRPSRNTTASLVAAPAPATAVPVLGNDVEEGVPREDESDDLGNDENDNSADDFFSGIFGRSPSPRLPFGAIGKPFLKTPTGSPAAALPPDSPAPAPEDTEANPDENGVPIDEEDDSTAGDFFSGIFGRSNNANTARDLPYSAHVALSASDSRAGRPALPNVLEGVIDAV